MSFAAAFVKRAPAFAAVSSEGVSVKPEGETVRDVADGYSLTVEPRYGGRIVDWVIGETSVTSGKGRLWATRGSFSRLPRAL